MASFQRDVARFVDDHVETAPKSRLVVLLYERLSLDLARAEAALLRQDHPAAHNALVHGQAIVTELHTALDVDVWDGGPALAALYVWLQGEMSRANVRKDGAVVADCRRVVDPLRDAWREAAVLAPREGSVPAALVG